MRILVAQNQGVISGTFVAVYRLALLLLMFDGSGLDDGAIVGLRRALAGLIQTLRASR
jgi:hypothetical protein